MSNRGFFIACNHTGSKIIRPGTKCRVLFPVASAGYVYMVISARSRGGRRIQKYESARRLYNFRPSWCEDLSAMGYCFYYALYADKSECRDKIDKITSALVVADRG